MARNRLIGFSVIAIILAMTTAAHAEGAQKPVVLKPYELDTRPQALDPVKAQPRMASVYAQTNALRAAGIARTSVDRRFDGDETTGSLGFLCGIQPSHDFSGGASAYGADPHGRFLGAKFSRAF